MERIYNSSRSKFLFLFVVRFLSSAGVGRTGVFIVIDAMLERIKHVRSIDIYGHVTCLRSQRNYMVQTEDQYIFIHDAILEAIQSGNTEIPARNLYLQIQKLTERIPGESFTGMDLEFKVYGAFLSLIVTVCMYNCIYVIIYIHRYVYMYFVYMYFVYMYTRCATSPVSFKQLLKTELLRLHSTANLFFLCIRVILTDESLHVKPIV